MTDISVTSTPHGPATIAGNTVGDQPTTEDSLGFTPYVQAITAFLTSPATQPPLTMSVEGEWGSGKSSFMLQLERAIRGPGKKAVFTQNLPTWAGGPNAQGSILKALWLLFRTRPRITIQFNAWRHDKQDALWAAFALKFTKSMRQQVSFLSGWQGDISLFLRRLRGIRGWIELLFLVTCLLLLSLGLVGLYRFASTHSTTDIEHVISMLIAKPGNAANGSHEPPQGTQPKTPSPGNAGNTFEQLPQPYEFLLSHGKWGVLLACGIAGFIRFQRHWKLSLSIDLERYLTKPDYHGRVAFIENFHEDFGRVLKAYAKNSRIFVFIDDLDRCDVPRAAELMQAINLMIGDAGQMVFLLGMDREKVAAGIAQKYKDLLPFFSEFVSEQDGQLGPLYFGYSYLEKFIQLSFVLPVIAGKDSLRRFLASISPRAPHPTWLRRLVAYWGKPKAQDNKESQYFHNGHSQDGQSQPASAEAENSVSQLVAQEKKIQYLRVKVEKDSEEVIEVVSMVSPMFKNNPRRLKQFVNTFRLGLFIASRQGLLDRGVNFRGVTPEQLGKFIAITLRFPSLRINLTSTIIQKMQFVAQADGGNTDYTFDRWLRREGVAEVLRHGVVLGNDPFDPDTYSLNGFPVEKFLSILPEVPEPPTQSDRQTGIGGPTPKNTVADVADSRLLQAFEVLANQYETIRRTEEAGGSRTMNMTRVFEEAREKAVPLSSTAAVEIFQALTNNSSSGFRLMAIAVAAAHPARTNVQWLLEALDDFLSPFEHYQCIQTMLRHFEFLNGDDCIAIIEILNQHWSKIRKDSGRIGSAKILRSKAEEWLKLNESSAK